jgi:leucine dehydrogenase
MELDVLALSAVGGALDARTVEETHARIIAGAANNQLATIEDGDRLFQRGICYLPDFLVNAGGIISVAHEYLETGTEERVTRDIECIAERVERLIYFSRQYRMPPTRVALSWAKAAIDERTNSP